MLINLSNHPSSRWDEKQVKAAQLLGGRIIDLPFPQVDPASSEEDVEKLAQEIMSQIWDIIKENMTTTDTESDDFESVVVHVMGEQTLCWHLLAQLKDRRIPAVASTTERKVEEKDGVKTSVFQFVQFRHYFGGSQWHIATAVEKEWQEREAEQRRLSDAEFKEQLRTEIRAEIQTKFLRNGLVQYFWTCPRCGMSLRRARGEQEFVRHGLDQSGMSPRVTTLGGIKSPEECLIDEVLQHRCGSR